MGKKKRNVVKRLFFARWGDGIFKVEGDHVGLALIHTVQMLEIERVEHHVGSVTPYRSGSFMLVSELGR